MALGNRNKKRPTKGFSELNKRTYDVSPQGKREIRNRTNNNNKNSFAQRVSQNNRQSSLRNQSTQNYPSQERNLGQMNPLNDFQPQNAYSTPTGGQSNTRYSNGNYFQPPRSDNSKFQNAELLEFSRDNYSMKYREQVNAAKKKKRRRIIIIIAAAILAALIGAGVAVASIFGNMNAGMNDIGLTPTQYANQPFYMVLMGVDSSEERKSEGGTDEDYRSDSIILARIDPVEKKASLVSLHRDVEVDMGEHGKQKLNAAHSLGGPELVVKTVSKLAGVPINHYAEINFDGFKAAVDKLGGIDIEVPMEINDELAGGYVPAGQQHLNGEQALILCRARHAYDDYGDGDKYRAANQRLVLSAIAKKALSSDILTIAQTVTELSKHIKTDLGLNDMIGLAQVMKDIDPATQVYSAMMPTTPEYKNDTWYENLNEKEWKEMMKRMDQGLPPSEETYVDPKTGTVLSTSGNSTSGGEAKMSGTVAVRNGTTTEGKAATAANKLTNLGFNTDVANANSSDYTTTIIVYTNDSQKATAEAIKEALGCGKVEKNNDEYLYSTDYLVVVGTDYKG